jgi:uncharacterized membrane-anchored protein YjiN (DUF445 family)
MNNHEMKMIKFATQIEDSVLKDLKTYANLTDKSISKIVTEAIAEHIKKAQVRPAFKTAMNAVLDENKELLKRLAK